MQLIRLTRIDWPVGIAGAEELLAHRFADDADVGAAAHLGIGEQPALGDVPVARHEIFSVGSGDLGGYVLGAVDDADLSSARQRKPP